MLPRAPRVRPVRLGLVALTVTGSLIVGGSAAATNGSPLTGAKADNANGTAYCDSKGVFDNGRITAELTGTASSKDAANTAATNVTCELVQFGSTVLRTSRTAPGATSATSTTGSIPVQPTQVCASGFVVPSDGGANRPITRTCSSAS